MLDRKLDTRKKIQLGGLLIKAGFGDLHPQEAEMIFGMLLECRDVINSDDIAVERWRRTGQALLVK